MKHLVRKKIEKTLKALKVPPTEGFSVDNPPEKMGDYSSNVALVYAKVVKLSPRELAEKIREKLLTGKDSVFEKIEIAGPGFINFYLGDKALVKTVEEVLKKKSKFGGGKGQGAEKVLLEYFQPNIAKTLHLGHLQNAVLGDSLFRILKFAGYKVESDTHLGDWGTQFGLLLHAYKKYGDEKVIARDPIHELNKFYIRINEEMKGDPEVREAGKREFVKLERGDKENLKIWKKVTELSWKEFEYVYRELGIRRADHNWPESFFEDKMPSIVGELGNKGLLASSQGAKIVDLGDHGLGVAIIIKSDEGTTYLLRDLAAFVFRKSKKFTRQLYVIDSRQKHTLAQTFKILQLLGHIKSPGEAVHIDYGFTSLPEGAMSSRSGSAIEPKALIDKARELVEKIIAQKNPNLKNRSKVAQQVAIGAVKYFYLSHNRRSDIVFRWEEVLNFEGNTGPYLQYTHARIKSILRKAGKQDSSVKSVDINQYERSLAVSLLKFEDVVIEAAETYFPNALAEYLYSLAGAFNLFYQKVQVLGESDPGKKKFRVKLVAAVAQVLSNGLELLGISAPEEM